MNGRPAPTTAAEHREEAIALLAVAEDYSINSTIHLVYATRAAAHAALANYRPIGRPPKKPTQEGTA